MKKINFSDRHASFVFLTGAGISKESGLDTFRQEHGLWAEHKISDVATPESFKKNPELVHSFYNKRRKECSGAKPNAAHIALARLEAEWDGRVTIVTQNVDDLHEKAGSHNVIHMHGSLNMALCNRCNARFPSELTLTTKTICAQCQKKEGVRPDIVWFGENPYQMGDIIKHLGHCRFFISVGTSSQVYPAAGFVQMAKQAYKIEINLKKTPATIFYNQHINGKASLSVPKFINAILFAD